MALYSLSMNELARAVQLGGRQFMEQASWSDVFTMSYEAGGVYPTLAGYGLGSLGTLFLTRGSSWMMRLVLAIVCLALLWHTFHSLHRKSLEWILVIAAVTGMCCTYAQLASLDLIREHFAFSKMPLKKKKKTKKID